MYYIKKAKVWLKFDDNRRGIFLVFHGCYIEDYNMVNFRELCVVRHYGFSGKYEFISKPERKGLKRFTKYYAPPMRYRYED
jgi:hypothetical protein